MKSGAVGSWKHSGTGLRCVPQEPWDGGSGAVPESSRWVYLGSVWGLPTAQQGEEWSARVSLEDARVRSRLCSPCTCENTVRVFPRGEPDPRLVLPQFPSWHAGEAIHLPRLPYSSVSCSTLFSPHWAHLCRAAVAETLKLHLQGRQELWGGLRNLEVGLWEPSPTDPGRQQPQSARLQLFAKAS